MTQRIIPAMTLWQPYASLIAVGLKPYETRAFHAPARLIGFRIAIHAAKRPIGFGEITPEIDGAMKQATGDNLWFERIPFGAIVCIAVLDSVHRAGQVKADPFGDYSPGRWAWKLTDVQPLDPPVPAKGERLYGWPWIVPDGLRL